MLDREYMDALCKSVNYRSYLFIIRCLSAKQACRCAMYVDMKLIDTDGALKKSNVSGIC